MSYSRTKYEELVALLGLGPKNIRALPLVSELVYMVQALAGKIRPNSPLPMVERMEHPSLWIET